MVVIEAGILGLAGSLIGAAVGLVVEGFWWPGRAEDSAWRSIRRGPRSRLPSLRLLISVTASIYPAGMASRQSIVRALQHD